MKTIPLLLLLCLPAYAATPPMPVGNVGLGTSTPSTKLYVHVERPAPLLSPRHASQPKSTPMVKLTLAGETSLSTLAPTRPPVFETNLTIVQIDGSVIVRDKVTIYAIQRVGKGIRVEASDAIPATWDFLADWGPYVEEQIIVTERYTDPAFRAQARFFRVVEYNATAAARSALMTAPYRVNPNIKGVYTWKLVVPK